MPVIHKLLPLAGGLLAAATLSACASQPHTDATMLSGSHPMAPKAGMMSDKAMPNRSADCTKEALDKMPPEHRAECEKVAAPKS